MEFRGILTTSIYAYPNNRIAVCTPDVDFATLCKNTKIIELGYPQGKPNYKGVFKVVDVIDNRAGVKQQFPKEFLIIVDTKFNYDSFNMQKINLSAIIFNDVYSYNPNSSPAILEAALNVKIGGFTRKEFIGKAGVTRVGNAACLAKDSNEIAISTYDAEYKLYNEIQTRDIPLLKISIKEYLAKDYEIKKIPKTSSEIDSEAENIIKTEYMKIASTVSALNKMINDLKAIYDIKKFAPPVVNPDLTVTDGGIKPPRTNTATTTGTTGGKTSNQNMGTAQVPNNIPDETPFYKKKWFMIGVPVGVLGLAVASYFIFRNK